MAAFSHQIDNRPMPLPNLYVFRVERHQFGAAEAAADQSTDHGVIPLRAQIAGTGTVQYLRALFQAQPVARAPAQLLDAFNVADSRR